MSGPSLASVLLARVPAPGPVVVLIRAGGFENEDDSNKEVKMLVLSRRPGEAIVIGEKLGAVSSGRSIRIVIKIVAVSRGGVRKSGKVRLAIDAPKEMSIVREECGDGRSKGEIITGG